MYIQICLFSLRQNLAIILFGPELPLHNVFSPPHNKFVFYITIVFILLSAYAFYLDQFEIYCVVKSTSIFSLLLITWYST